MSIDTKTKIIGHPLYVVVEVWSEEIDNGIMETYDCHAFSNYTSARVHLDMCYLEKAFVTGIIKNIYEVIE